MSAETPVERRLREMAIPESSPYIGARSAAALNIGREAIALLREWVAIDDGAGAHSEVAYANAIDIWKDAALALLARLAQEGT